MVGRWTETFHFRHFFPFISFQAAEKVTVVPETNGSCLLTEDEVDDERPPLCEETSKKNTRQKKPGKAKSQENLTERENAKNHEKTLTNDVNHDTTANRRGSLHEPGGNTFDEKPAPVKQEPETGNHVDKRKKNKEKKFAINKSGENAPERRVIVNGSAPESGTYMEHTRGVRLPVREEAEPKHCGEEAPAQETQTENQGRKTKSRRKKKGQNLGKITNTYKKTTVQQTGQGFHIYWYLDHFTFGIQCFVVKIGWNRVSSFSHLVIYPGLSTSADRRSLEF